MHPFTSAFATVLILLHASLLAAQEPGRDKALVAHWPLKGDAKDISGNGHHAINRGVDLKAESAIFNGRGAHLEVPAKALALGKGDFSIALWLHTQRDLDDVPGDLASCYDPSKRRGFQLTIKNSAVTSSQANARHLQFSIDNDKESPWIDCGKPGKAILAFALATHERKLYAGTCEPGKSESGRVYRYAGDKRWIDCGSPASCNSVTALAVHDGKLYAGVGKYRLGGSALKESENPNLGGRVFRYEGESKWTDCGQLPNTEAIGGFVVYRGKLYASSLYKPAGFYRYDGGDKWTDCGTPNGKRVEALAVYDGFLYASSYDHGHVYRYDGKTWTDCGQLGDNTQTYSFAIHHGQLYVGTWPSGRVFRFEDVNRWKDVGRLGQEKEVMGMLVHNGRLLAGTLPLAEVYQYEGEDRWKKLAQLDKTPDVTYRRAWTAAEHQGRVYFSTLPSGHVYSFEAGKTAAWEHELPAGWHHVAAVKRAGRLEIFLDGKRVATSEAFEPADYDLTTDSPLKVGAGATDFFHGRMRDVRLYQRSLTEGEIQDLAQIPKRERGSSKTSLTLQAQPKPMPITVVNRKTLAADRIDCERIPLGADDDYKPDLILMPDGELILVAFHQHKKDGNKVLEQNLLFRSKDGGKTWSKPEKLGLLGREPYLTVLKDGTLFITGHLLAADVRNPHGYIHGYLHRSTDAGKNWESIRIESEGIKPKQSNHSTRNVLELADGTLLLGVDYDGGQGPFLMWRSKDRGKTWDKTQKCEPKDFKSIYGFFGGETWLWAAKSGKIWALVRVDSNELPIKGRPITSKNDQSDHFILFSSKDQGRSFDRIRDIGDYGEMYMSILRLQDKRLLLTFTVRDLHPPLGVRAIPGIETDDAFEFDFTKDRIMLDTKTGKRSQGGGFGPTVQLKDGTLVTSYSYRGADDKTHLEVVRWRLPPVKQ